MVAYATRPAKLTGCWQSWQETQNSQVLRTGMENGDVKVRRRTTGVYRRARVVVALPKDRYHDFVDWYHVVTGGGVQPTNVVEPNGVESVWRFASELNVEWPSAEVVRFGVELEKLPGWQEL